MRGGDSEAPWTPPLAIFLTVPPTVWEGDGEGEVLAPGRVERSASAIALRTCDGLFCGMRCSIETVYFVQTQFFLSRNISTITIRAQPLRH